MVQEKFLHLLLKGQKIKQKEYHEFGLLLPSFKTENENNKIDNYELEKIWAEAIIKFIKNKQDMISYAQKSLARCEDFSSTKITKKWKKLILE